MGAGALAAEMIVNPSPTASAGPLSPRRTAIVAAVADYVADRVPALAGRSIAPDTPLLASGLDSLGVLELTLFLAERFGIEVEDEDFLIEHFETVGSVASFVEERAHL